MKKNRKKIINMAFACTIIAGGATLMVGCEKDSKYSIVWSDSMEDVISLQPGESLMLFAKRDDEKTATITYAITEGGEYAAISNTGILTVSKNAPVGQTIKVQAFEGKVKSSEMKITVTAVKEISLKSSVTSNIVDKGEEITLSTTYKNTTDAVSDVVYKITAGSEYATITNNLLKINDNAPAFSVITVMSESAITTSNTLTFIVAEEAPQFTLTWDESMEENPKLQPGESLLLIAKRSDNQASAINYVITAGNEYASITTGGILQISKNAPANLIIKVKANSGGVVSDEYTVTVIETSDIVLTSSALAQTVNREDEITLNAIYKDTENAVEGVTYKILQGSEYATLTNNILKINEEAPDFAIITVIAETELTQSGTLTFIVVQEAPQFQVVWGNEIVDKSLQQGESTTLIASRSDNVSSAITYVITEGSEYATVSTTGVVTISKTAAIGQIVKVKAVCDGVESSEITFTVIAVKEIVLTTNAQSTTVMREDEITLTTNYKNSLVPVNNVTYRITSGSEYATIVGNKLIINEDAADASSITIIAESAITTSNTITFTVYVPAQKDMYFIYPTESTITVDLTSDGASKAIAVNTLNIETGSLEQFTASDYKYEIEEGSEYVSIDENGYVTAIGHGRATVKVIYESENPLINDAFTTITINAVVPPETIELSEMLTKQATKEVSYLGFGMQKVDDRSLDLGITGRHTVATYFANKYKVNVYVDGQTTPSVGYAIYDNETGKLTFNEISIGHELRVEILSDTGANREARAEFTINVNNGFNVHNGEDLKYLNKNDQKVGMILNFLEDCIITGTSTNVNGTGSSLLRYKIHMYADSYIYGNGHKVDFSQVVNEYKGVGEEENFIIITNELYGGTRDLVVNRDFDVKIYDFNIYGNNGYNKPYLGESSTTPTAGAFDIAIRVEGANRYLVSDYLAGKDNRRSYHAYLDINNLNINGFQTAMNIRYANSKQATEFEEAKISKISNLVIDNCLESGLEIEASILTLENIKLGKVGTTGIETTPAKWWQAGENFDQPQTITLRGRFESTNDNAFNSTFANTDPDFKKLNVGAVIGGTVSQLKINTPFGDVHFEAFLTEKVKIDENDPGADGIRLINLSFNNIQENSIWEQGAGREFVNGTVIKFEALQGSATDLVSKVTEFGTQLQLGNQTEAENAIKDLLKSRFITMKIPTGQKIGSTLAMFEQLDPTTRDYLKSYYPNENTEIFIGSIVVENPLYDLLDKDGKVEISGVKKTVDELTILELMQLVQVQEVIE